LAIQLLFNGVLTLFFVYCYFYIGATAPAPKPDTMDAAQWPQMLLILLVFFLIINMYNIIKRTPKEERNFKTLTGINYIGIFKNKLVIGIVLLFVYAFALDYIGFILGTFLFCIGYSRLLGEKRIKWLLVYSFLIVAVLYILFTFGLNIMLPRGVGELRNFALMLESI
jgi:hypothetical protein